MLQFQIYALALLLCFVSSKSHAQDRLPVDGRTRVVMLGTGNPAPSPERAGPATAIVVDSTPYLIDFGVGVVRRWNAALVAGVGPMPVWGLRTAFVTHLHTDHTLGYAELIFTPWTVSAGDIPPLRVFGPAGLQAMTANILAAYREDISVRTGPSGGLAGSAAPQVQVEEITPGVVYRDDLVTVTAFLVRHGAWEQAFGYRFDTPDKVVVISGDTASPSVITDYCKECDILIHEAALPEGPAVTEYYRDNHTTAEQLAVTANRSRPKLLVIYHQRGDETAQRVLERVRANYTGPVVSARDGDVFR